MSRAKRGFKARHRRKKILTRAKGFRGSRNARFRTAIHVVRRAMVFSYRDRRVKKREFRRLWITRINAACRSCGVKYSQFIYGLKKNDIAMDRSILADMAIHDFAGFQKLVKQVS